MLILCRDATRIFLLKHNKSSQVQEWLYMDGEDASATEFQERLDLLKAIGDPMFFRYAVLVLPGIIKFSMPILV